MSTKSDVVPEPKSKVRRHRNRLYKKNSSFDTYIYKVLKQVHPDSGIKKGSMRIMNSLVYETFQKVLDEAGIITRMNDKHTITSREIQSAVKLVVPGELAKHAVSEGTKAVTRFNASGSGPEPSE